MLDEGTPIFAQIAERLADEIVDAVLAEGERVPSSNELATFYRINPATAAKGLNVLIDDGLLDKRRGIGMFVAQGARERLLAQRRRRFAERYVDPLVAEATRVGIGTEDLLTLIDHSIRAGQGSTGMTPAISVAGLTRRYRDQLAIDNVSFEVGEASIAGLLGRNGAGKTTLLRILAGQELASAGRVQVSGASPVDNDAVLRRIVLVREDQVFPDLSVDQVLRVASWFYPSWSAELAGSLRLDFELPPRRRVSALSRGQRSALGIVLALAARAEVTLLDEPYAGLDAVARQIFYDRLLADVSEHPRAVLISTHLIDEIADLLEQVVVLDRGRVVLDAATDELRGAATAVSGSAPALEQFVAGRRISGQRQLASQASAVVHGALDAAAGAHARSLHLRLEPLSLQQVVIHAADGSAGEATARSNP